MYIESIKRAAFNDELEKIASSLPSASRIRGLILRFKQAVVAKPIHYYRKARAAMKSRRSTAPDQEGGFESIFETAVEALPDIWKTFGHKRN
jgi:hypothetical protein